MVGPGPTSWQRNQQDYAYRRVIRTTCQSSSSVLLSCLSVLWPPTSADIFGEHVEYQRNIFNPKRKPLVQDCSNSSGTAYLWYDFVERGRCLFFFSQKQSSLCIKVHGINGIVITLVRPPQFWGCGIRSSR